MTDPFREFVEQLARMTIGSEMPELVKTAAEEQGAASDGLEEADLIASASDELLCSETAAFWAMIRSARKLLEQHRTLPQ